tara:strand:+ start:123 stop:755 length:633 start_codon:yes stop_codon:yes gene_type:complete
MKIDTKYHFPTPFWKTNITSEIKKINISIETLINECFVIQKNDKGTVISNAGINSYHSNNLDFSKTKNSSLLQIGKILHDIIQCVYQSTWQGNLEIDNAWININRKDGQNIIHNHPESILSGCLYLQVPKNSGCFALVRETNEQYIYRNYGKLNNDKENNLIYLDHVAQEVLYKPMAGDVFLFPSHLLHCVKPNQTSKARISIAFNTKKQ